MNRPSAGRRSISTTPKRPRIFRLCGVDNRGSLSAVRAVDDRRGQPDCAIQYAKDVGGEGKRVKHTGGGMPDGRHRGVFSEGAPVTFELHGHR